MKYFFLFIFLFSSLSACDKCYMYFNEFSKEEHYDTISPGEIYWIGYSQGMRQAYTQCKAIFLNFHPEYNSN